MIVVAPGANGHLTLASARARGQVIADCEDAPCSVGYRSRPPWRPRPREPRSVGSHRDSQCLPRQHRGDPGLRDLADITDVVIVNKADGSDIGPRPYKASGGHPRRPRRELPDRPRRGPRYTQPPRSKRIDTTGAGVSFAGVLAAGLVDRATSVPFDEPARRARSRRWFPAPEIAHRHAEAIDDVLTPVLNAIRLS